MTTQGEMPMLDRRELMGRALFLLGASAFGAALGGCAQTPADHYFSRGRRAILDEIADLLIPETDTPGARGVGVSAIVDRMMAQWASAETRAAFDAILDDIDAQARQAHQKAFVELEPAQRLAAYAAFDAASLANPSSAYGRLKELLLTAYYLSEAGATVELRYELVPGPWRGDIPLSEIGRSWAM
jgi:gluconate 2-dehydrogenase gamma chain